MHLRHVTLTVRHDTKTVHAHSARGLASRAKEEELHARSELRDWLAITTAIYGTYLFIDLWLLGWCGILVFIGCITAGEAIAPGLSKFRGPLVASWYALQWKKKWHIEYCRQCAKESQPLT